MQIRQVMIYREDGTFHPGTITVKDGRFAEMETDHHGEVIDGQGAYAIPGLIDLHFHGCAGADFCDANREAFQKIADYEASVGVTRICPATMTLAEDDLHRVMKAAARWKDLPGAKFAGIHMEGPFINPQKRGAHAEEHIRRCDVDLFETLQEEAKGQIRLVDLAPEMDGAMEFIDAVKGKAVLSAAHTAADYETGKEAMERGISHVTHLFNAMSPFTHREPGIVGAAIEDKTCRVELICDGIHLHPATVRAAFSLFGKERILLISDSMRATGLKDGTYTLGGQKVDVKRGKATLKDGTIAGSVTNLMECVRIAVKEMGIPLEDVIPCATKNPAQELGIYDRCGSISVGKEADFVLLDGELNVKAVYLSGSEYKGDRLR